MPRPNCEACHDEVPPYTPGKVYVSEVGKGEIPDVVPNWQVTENLSPEARRVAGSDVVQTYLKQLTDLERRQVPTEALIPRFPRDRQFCGQFVIPGTPFRLSIDNPHTQLPEMRERSGLAVVRLWADPIDMGHNYGGTHIHSVGTIATIAVGRELPKHL